jgi:hypothetical protein
VNPEIKSYLDEHGATYTEEALRRGLLDAGYDPAEVDAALKEWQASAAGPASVATKGRRFWLWVLGLHVAALAIIGVWAVAIGSFAANVGLLGILAVVLVIGVGISGLLSGGVREGRGLAIALVVPAVSALLIGGSCLALAGSYLLQAPPRTGVMQVHIDDALNFDGSGTAMCQYFGGTGGFSVWADAVVTLNGSYVSASLSGVPGAAASSQRAGESSLYINLIPKSGTERPLSYSTIFSTQLELDASSDGRSGTLKFEGLEPDVGEEPRPSEEPISGTVTWTCT